MFYKIRLETDDVDLRRCKYYGGPGLVIMGDDSCSRGYGFESRHHIQDGHDIFSH